MVSTMYMPYDTTFRLNLSYDEYDQGRQKTTFSQWHLAWCISDVESLRLKLTHLLYNPPTAWACRHPLVKYISRFHIVSSNSLITYFPMAANTQYLTCSSSFLHIRQTSMTNHSVYDRYTVYHRLHRVSHGQCHIHSRHTHIWFAVIIN